MIERSANPAAFGKGATFVMVLLGIAAFLSFIFLAGQGGLAGQGNDGQAHVAGRGLNGFAALSRLLEADGTPVVRSRDGAALTAPGLLVLTPPAMGDTDDVARIIRERRNIGPTLVIAPKWLAVPAQQQGDAEPGWVFLANVIEEWSLEIEGRSIIVQPEREIDAAPQWTGFARSGDLPGDRALSGITRESAEGLIATLVESEGLMLVGYLADDGSYLDGDLSMPQSANGELIDSEPQYGVMLVAEPDLLNNWGLASRENANLALGLIAIARQGTEAPVQFDLTLNGLGGQRNLLTLAFEPPFLAATLCLMLALLIVFWRAFARLGPAVRATPEIAHGKTQLVHNSADLTLRSGRTRLISIPFANLAAQRIAQALGIRASDPAELDDALRDRGHTAVSPLLADLRSARRPATILRAAKALREFERTLHR